MDFYTWVTIVSGLIGFFLLLYVVWNLVMFYKQTSAIWNDLRNEED